jgi:hypothetical protein
VLLLLERQSQIGEPIRMESVIYRNKTAEM